MTFIVQKDSQFGAIRIATGLTRGGLCLNSERIEPDMKGEFKARQFGQARKFKTRGAADRFLARAHDALFTEYYIAEIPAD